MILLIDNYDSFSYNLYQYLGSITTDIRVIRNDAMTPEEISDLNPSGIIISPGPGRPSDAGVCEDVVKKLGSRIPIFGVCLGEQAICEAYGGKIVHAKHLMHGKQSLVRLDNSCPVFKGMKKEIPAARYHSLAVDGASLPDCLKVTAETSDHEVMAVMHREYPVYGVQFHPESIMTPDGMEILKNFVGMLDE
ncbi:MAG: aminodeoxychorismate/anthranilate synthase component II [Lachnospiraceae bacterium]|jgi:anthranilate synthase component 2|nr:aminodeoxychorismate/anthranilate synthase component II [Lachnospiraceae bacterium]MEE3461984.1 aminodeoxychorismate/anthranilate synthase component II [Lachnospiraceae bacterium]